MSKLLDILTIILASFSILSIVTLLILGFFTEQEKIYNSNISCLQLKECIILELTCMEHKTINKFLTFEWSFSGSSSVKDQIEFYKNSCFQLNDSSRGEKER